ncbi:MAG TPA: hypothetical protein P5105_02485 [Victivallales bacterium]|nr:hypothetical protein [Victivallales bacterium]HPO90744.1 hypothetical protein [Victivallales bacterium]HRR06127.1 hypothetical protein [Victivallales bacterium]HRR28397.1 hypothetical protein [Victivallales bacterium]HRU00154.1 hypothetical protein [Victivallales bacterium]
MWNHIGESDAEFLLIAVIAFCAVLIYYKLDTLCQKLDRLSDKSNSTEKEEKKD